MGIRPGPAHRRLAFSTEAENYVADTMTRQGWRIFARNVRHIGFELDVIAGKGRTLVAVEVKARRSVRSALFEPKALMNDRKRVALERGLLWFISKHADKAAHFEVLRLDLALVVRRRVGQGFELHYYPNV